MLAVANRNCWRHGGQATKSLLTEPATIWRRFLNLPSGWPKLYQAITQHNELKQRPCGITNTIQKADYQLEKRTVLLKGKVLISHLVSQTNYGALSRLAITHHGPGQGNAINHPRTGCDFTNTDALPISSIKSVQPCKISLLCHSRFNGRCKRWILKPFHFKRQIILGDALHFWQKRSSLKLTDHSLSGVARPSASLDRKN